MTERTYSAYACPGFGIGWSGRGALGAALRNAVATAREQPGSQPYVTVRDGDGPTWIVLTPEQMQVFPAAASPLRRAGFVARCFLINKSKQLVHRYPGGVYVRGHIPRYLPLPEARWN